MYNLSSDVLIAPLWNWNQELEDKVDEIKEF